MDKLLNNGITGSVKDVIKSRLSSSIYGTYIVFWIIFHWKFIFTIFFMSEDIILKNTGLLKNEYLSQTFFEYNFTYWLWWILPLFCTCLTIWILPKIFLLPAFKKEQEYEFEKKKIEIKNQKELIKESVDLEKEKIKELDMVVEKTEKEKQIEKTDPKIKWEEDYKKFIFAGYSENYISFLNGFYGGSRNLFSFIPGDISYFDALGLIEINNGLVENLTDKGKYFALKVKEDMGTSIK